MKYFRYILLLILIPVAIHKYYSTSPEALKNHIASEHEFLYETSQDHLKTYRLDVPYSEYYEYAQVKVFKDQLFIIFWGDRDSWLWKFKLDNHFYVERSSKNPLDKKLFIIFDKLSKK